jgi:hypothetical protein
VCNMFSRLDKEFKRRKTNIIFRIFKLFSMVYEFFRIF